MRLPAKFQYTSKCCGAATKKDPCERSANDRKAGDFSQAALGKWKCMNCKNNCSVTRSKTECANAENNIQIYAEIK